MRTLSTIDAKASSSSVVAAAPEQSPLHSPVPYLFGGLAAMLGLIAFALLILACSYWKLSRILGGGHDQREGEHSDEIGEAKSGDESIKVYEQKIVVIMAGDEIPTFLATPICIKASTFGDHYSINQDKKEDDEIENPKGGETTTTTGTDQRDHHQTENRTTQETPNHHQNQ